MNGNYHFINAVLPSVTCGYTFSDTVVLVRQNILLSGSSGIILGTRFAETCQFKVIFARFGTNTPAYSHMPQV